MLGLLLRKNNAIALQQQSPEFTDRSRLDLVARSRQWRNAGQQTQITRGVVVVVADCSSLSQVSVKA
jgi:hypothetical protein